MRLDMNRICQLAGIPGSKRRSGYGLMREGAGHKEIEEFSQDLDYDGMMGEGEEEEDDDDDASKKEEMIHVDEAMLVQELRRAKRIMKESRRRKAAKRQQLQEMQLKAVIDQEVKNVIKDLQLNSGWMYGKRKPSRSRSGYTHQGSYLKGIGFK